MFPISNHLTTTTQTAEDKVDLEQMHTGDYATFSAEEYQAEIQDLFDELLTFMNRMDSLDELEGVHVR